MRFWNNEVLDNTDGVLADLERRTGRPTRIAPDPSLALEAAAAQIVPHD